MRDHDSNAAALLDSPPVGAKKLAGTDRTISPARAADRSAAAARFNRVAREEGWSSAAIAARLDCSDTYVDMLRSGARTLEAGHLERLGTLAIAYHRACLEELETTMHQAAQDAERLALRLGKKVGELQDSVLRGTADGHLDESERASICWHASELDQLVHQTRRSVGGNR